MMIIAKALVFDTENKILVLRRSNTHPRFSHHFDFPGGEVEDGEKAIATVAREIKEESGLSVQQGDFQLVHKDTSPKGTQHFIYSVEIGHAQPQIILSWEHEAYSWLTLDDLLKKELALEPDSFYLNILEYLQNLKPAN